VRSDSGVASRALEWRTPPPVLSLPAHTVHVWRADLGLEAAYLRRLEQNLSADERKRASRFRFARDRDRFVGARGLLREILARFGGEDKRTTFLRFWTLKEAYIKADGRGVSLPLERIDVSASDGRLAVQDQATGEWRKCPRWELRTLAPVPGYVTALAAEGQDWRLALWRWS
jgi:phosphopantetheinyl transferase